MRIETGENQEIFQATPPFYLIYTSGVASGDAGSLYYHYYYILKLALFNRITFKY